jgi:hypothetical protein
MLATKTDRRSYRSSATPSLYEALKRLLWILQEEDLIDRGQIAEATCPRVLLISSYWIT